MPRHRKAGHGPAGRRRAELRKCQRLGWSGLCSRLAWGGHFRVSGHAAVLKEGRGWQVGCDDKGGLGCLGKILPGSSEDVAVQVLRLLLLLGASSPSRRGRVAREPGAPAHASPPRCRWPLGERDKLLFSRFLHLGRRFQRALRAVFHLLASHSGSPDSSTASVGGYWQCRPSPRAPDLRPWDLHFTRGPGDC